jgi:hypothetical protein
MSSLLGAGISGRVAPICRAGHTHPFGQEDLSILLAGATIELPVELKVQHFAPWPVEGMDQGEAVEGSSTHALDSWRFKATTEGLLNG